MRRSRDAPNVPPVTRAYRGIPLGYNRRSWSAAYIRYMFSFVFTALVIWLGVSRIPTMRSHQVVELSSRTNPDHMLLGRPGVVPVLALTPTHHTVPLCAVNGSGSGRKAHVGWRDPAHISPDSHPMPTSAPAVCPSNTYVSIRFDTPRPTPNEA